MLADLRLRPKVTMAGSLASGAGCRLPDRLLVDVEVRVLPLRPAAVLSEADDDGDEPRWVLPLNIFCTGAEANARVWASSARRLSAAALLDGDWLSRDWALPLLCELPLPWALPLPCELPDREPRDRVLRDGDRLDWDPFVWDRLDWDLLAWDLLFWDLLFWALLLRPFAVGRVAFGVSRRAAMLAEW